MGISLYFIAAAAAVAATATAAVDEYADVTGPFTVEFAFAFTSYPAQVNADSWVRTALVLIGPLPPLGSTLSLMRNGVTVASTRVRNVTSVATAYTSTLPPPPVGTRWHDIAFDAPVPLVVGDIVSLSVASPGRRFAGGLVRGRDLSYAFNATRHPGLLVLSNDDGHDATVLGCCFSSGPLDATTVPNGAEVLSYALRTDIYQTSIRSQLAINGSEVAFSFLNTGDGGAAGVRWRAVGVATAVTPLIVSSRDQLVLGHSSLATSRKYTVGVLAADAATATASLTLRPPRPLVLGTNNDGIAPVPASSPTLSTGRLPVPAPGFLRSVDLRINPPISASCSANVTVRAGGTPGGVAGSAVVRLFNVGYGVEKWHAVLLPTPLPLPANGTVEALLTCGGGAIMRASVRRSDGAVLAAFAVESGYIASTA